MQHNYDNRTSSLEWDLLLLKYERNLTSQVMPQPLKPNFSIYYQWTVKLMNGEIVIVKYNLHN